MLLETAEGIIELKEDGTWTKHNVRFHNVNSKIFKEDLGTRAMTPIGTPVLLTVDIAMGNIEGVQKGFVLDHELSPPICPIAGKKYVKIYEKDLPEDFEPETYKVDTSSETVIKKDIAIIK